VTRSPVEVVTLVLASRAGLAGPDPGIRVAERFPAAH